MLSVLFYEEKYELCIRISIQIIDLGALCTFAPMQKYQKISTHRHDFLRSCLRRGGFLNVVLLTLQRRNVIVSFSLQSDTTLLSLEQCDISIAFLIFAKRYFLLSASGYRLLRKVA